MNIIITQLIAFVIGSLVGYLVLRNNPKYRAWLDAKANGIAKKKKG